MPHKTIGIIRFTLPLLFVFVLSPVYAQKVAGDHPQSQESLPDAPSAVRPPERTTSQASDDATRAEKGVDESWPRKATRGNETISMYQPQVESWKGDEVHAYAAIAVTSTANKTTKYGVLWFTARTEVDKVNRQVTLDDFQITRVKFPTMEAREAEYKTFLQAKLPKKAKVIALDRMEAALAVSDSEQAGVEALPVNNDPPKVIFTTKPALLVLIDGPAKFRDVGGTKLKLMLNTQATILLDTEKNEYYLNVMDGWLRAADLVSGAWSYVAKIPDDMKEITKGIQERQQAKKEEGTKPPSLKDAEKESKIPVIYVSMGPSELLVTEGPPEFELIPDTGLEYVKNTSASIFRDKTSLDYYILLAGRWFRSKSLETGPWEFVDGKTHARKLRSHSREQSQSRRTGVDLGDRAR